MSRGVVSIASIAEVNPGTERPRDSGTEVSFVPMCDVSEAGRWTRRQTRPLRDVQAGYTAFKEGDVLFAKITPCMENGKGALVKGLVGGIGFGSTEFHVLRAIPGKCEPEFLAQVAMLPELRERAVAYFTGSAGQRRVSAQFFEHYLVPSFTPSEQRHIVDVLSAVDGLIAQGEVALQKNAVAQQGVVQAALAQVTESPFEPLARLAQVSSGITLGRQFTGPGTKEYPYLRVANVQDGHIDLTEVKSLRLPVSVAAKARLEPGDVLMNEGGDFDKLGRGAVWKGQIANCLHQNHVFRVRCNRDVLLPEFLALWAASEFGKKFFMLASKQSTNLASINSTQLKRFPVLRPTLLEQQRVVNVAAALTEERELARQELKKLQLLKTGLARDLLAPRN